MRWKREERGKRNLEQNSFVPQGARGAWRTWSLRKRGLSEGKGTRAEASAMPLPEMLTSVMVLHGPASEGADCGVYTMSFAASTTRKVSTA